MEPDLQARTALLRGLTALLDKDNSLSASLGSSIMATIAQQQLLKDAVAATPAAAALGAEIDKFTTSVQRLHSKGKGASKAAAAALLRACIAQASHTRLVSEFQGVGQQLLDAVKKDTSAGNAAAAREACAALAELIGRCGAWPAAWRASRRTAAPVRESWGLGPGRRSNPPAALTAPPLCCCSRRLGEVIQLGGVRREVSGLVAKAVPVLNSLLAGEVAADRQAALGVVAAVLGTIPTALRPQLAGLEASLVKVRRPAVAAAAAAGLLRAVFQTGYASRRRCLSTQRPATDAHRNA
jgi:hypothetical protein